MRYRCEYYLRLLENDGNLLLSSIVVLFDTMLGNSRWSELTLGRRCSEN
jgi:hypothetical protein